ncbi:MAG: glycosyltransferase family 39 protein [Myxococcota bacterium]|nr:glycosyltransferase family 39 protein [Myxococcota bacterium]
MAETSTSKISEECDGPASAWGAMALLAGLAILAQLPLYDRSLVPMDEGHLLAASDALAAGKRLYADIHTGIFPGIYWVASALLEWLGRDALVLRGAALVTNSVTALALYAIGRRMVAPYWAWLPPLLYLALIVVSFPVLSMFNYSTLAVAFGLLALLFLLRYLERGRAWEGVVLGLLIAAAALTKQNFGGLIFVALLIALVLARRESALADRGLFAGLLPIVAGGLGLTLAAFLALWIPGAFPAFLDRTIFSLAGSQLQDFNNPIPPIFGAHPADDGRFVFLYTPPTIFNALVHGQPYAGFSLTPLLRSLSIRLSYGLPLAALILAPTLLFFTRHWGAMAARNAARSTVIFAIVFSPGIFPSAIWSHLAFVLIPILLLFALLGDRIEKMLQGQRSAARLWRILAGVLTGIALIIASRTALSVMDFYPEPLELERASLHVSARDAELLGGAVRFIQECSEPGQPVLILPDIPVLYFLADRPNPSPFDLAIPGNVDGPLIARQADAAQVRCAVLNPRMYPEFPPFEQLFPELAAHLEREFRVVREIRGGNSVWLGMVRRAR